MQPFDFSVDLEVVDRGEGESASVVCGRVVDSAEVALMSGFIVLPALQLFSYEMADYLGKEWISRVIWPRA